MRCARCDERFDPREETVMHEHDDVLRRFHPGCYVEYVDEGNPRGTARWSGGPPYQDIVLLGQDDLEDLLEERGDHLNLERLQELEEANRDREEVKQMIDEHIGDRDDVLDGVEQLEE